MEAEQVVLTIAAGGARFDAWQIARRSGRADALESTLQTVPAALAGRAARTPYETPAQP